MRAPKIFIIFTFLSAFAVCVSAQDYSYANELKGFELFKKGNWKLLKPLISTKEDVKRIFGKDCIDGCDYDEDWRVAIMYVECHVNWNAKKKAAPDIENKLIGKYSNLVFYPKRRITRNKLKVGKQFTKFRINQSHQSPSELEVYNDSFGLSYHFSVENSEDGKFFKGDLAFIIYGLSDLDYKKYENKIKRC